MSSERKNIVFLTFGGGEKKYIHAAHRLYKQALEFKAFTQCLCFTDEDLKHDDEFWKTHGEFVTNNKRGYGYWIWKPYLIMKVMNTLKDGDALVYLDAGCEILPNKSYLFHKALKWLPKFHIIDSKVHSRFGPEVKWTKRDLLKYLKCDNEKVLHSLQYQGGAVMYHVGNTTRKFINEWYALCSNYRLIDDSPSQEKEHYWFFEHRHDQSVYSLLKKKYNIDNNVEIRKIFELVRNASGTSKF